MFRYATLLLRWSRTLGQRFFVQFGLHCATHQIRIILISCVVITSLFYPALAIYTSSQHRSLSIIDTFISPSTPPAFEAQKDLENLWTSHNKFRIHEDPVARVRCGAGRALRVERLLIQDLMSEDGTALGRQTLLSTLDLERRLEKYISDGDSPCLKRSDGRCLVLSPLLFWNHDREILLSDTNILNKLRLSKNISVDGLEVTPEMVLASRGSNEPQVAASKFDFATFLALTYFFPESDCLGDSEHASWLDSVYRALSQKPISIVQAHEPTIISLEYDHNLSKTSEGEGWSALSTFLYLAYIGFIGYVVWSVRNMTAVHSRLGVTFTALVEIAVSTVTSLSVCALVGFKVTMVPWELLPIVIVFVGAENMFNLVDAVGKTSVTLSVKQRIAEGLGRAGTSNTLKVVSYNAILGVIAVFSVGAVRQFCSFAIVVLVAHWFLAHTFFLAVLSIDIQRLELSELLRHDSSGLAPAIPRLPKENAPKKPPSPWQKLSSTVQNLLKGRAATNLSLLMLLAITGTLYYTTYTASTFTNEQAAVSQLHTSPLPPTSRAEMALNKNSTAWHVWKTLNPTQAPLLHIRIELPNIVTFQSDIQSQKVSQARFSMRTFRLFLWLIKIMVLPIAATTSVLWGLLLYLLKNADLLEAQRNHAEPDSSDLQEDSEVLESEISFSTLPRAFTSDVELIAASKDGTVVVSVGLHNEIIIWRVDKQSHISIDAADVLLRAASTSFALSTLTSVAVDDEGRYCAVGTGAGLIAVWALEADSARPLPLLSLDSTSAAVTDLHFAPGSKPMVGQLRSQAVHGLALLATYESGVAVKWSLKKASTPTYFTPSHRASIVKCCLIRVDPLDHFLIAFSMDDGTLELVDTHAASPFITSPYCVQAGDALNTPSTAHACQADLGGRSRLIIAVATEAGLVSLWDGATGECISVLDEVYGRVNRLRIAPVQCSTCRRCGQLPLESVAVAFSVDHVVRFFRLYLNDETRRCACARHQLRHVASRDSIGHRSRSNSTASQVAAGSVSPSIPRARLATTFETSTFPVSGHGVHSRRASEKDTGRRSFDTLTVPFPGDEYGADTRPTTSFWHDAVLVRVADIACERGGWGMNGRKLIGVRRKPRTQGGSGARIKVGAAAAVQGLTAATLERWELWTFDPTVARVQSALLAALSTTPASDAPVECVPRLPFTRVSPLLIAPTHALAGFGNTVGIFNFS